MAIKSSLLNSKEFAHLKRNIIELSQEDGLEDWRVKLIEYINDSSSDEDDQFFYEQLEFARFLPKDTEAVAYTSENKLIYLNAPGVIGQKIREWEFIYDHECLHQLWDTFGVRDKIQKEGKKYNHYILNLASDCVINDYLSYNRKKPQPDNTVTPESIRSKFGVEYDRRVDTQYSLYCKMMNSSKVKEIEEYAKMQENIHEGKIDPKEIKKVEEEQGGSFGGPAPKHSEEYRKGWIDGINDVLDGKVDPKKYTHKSGKDDYTQGYNDVIDNIKKGVEEGIEQSSGSSNGGGQSPDLPEIPWNAPNVQDGSSNSSGDSSSSNSGQNQQEKEKSIDDMTAEEAAKDAQKSADKAKEAASKAQEGAKNAKGSDSESKKQEAADKANDAAKKAQKAADKAKDAADKGNKNDAREQAKEAAKEAANASAAANEAAGGSSSNNANIDKMSGTQAAKDAKESAERAKKAAEKAQSKADAAKKAGAEDADEMQNSADRAKAAAEKAKAAAEKAQEAADEGEEKEAQEAAKEARKNANTAENQANKHSKQKGSGWSGKDHLTSQDGVDDNREDYDINEIRERAKNNISRWQRKISGDIGEFMNKCRNSADLKESGLAVTVRKGQSAWNQKMDAYMNSFVKMKVFNAHREYKRTYKRINRRQGVVKYGEPLLKGKTIKDDKLLINTAFYIDVSGSMRGCIEDVFEAAYTISEGLKESFGTDKVVDDVTFKMFIFNTQIKEIKWGTKYPAGGNNVEFHEIVQYMSKHTKEFMINVVITDARFKIGKNEVKNFIKDIDGMLLFITNNECKDMEELSKEFKNKIFYVLADSNFTIGDVKIRK